MTPRHGLNASLRRLRPIWPSVGVAYSNKAVNKHHCLHNRSSALYFAATAVAIGGAVYGCVPLYRMFCQETGFSGTPRTVEALTSAPIPVANASPIQVTFESNIGNEIPWRFVPEQRCIRLVPGQTTLAFYRAENMSDRDVTGIATYNIVPPKAARYFNKIQCFCFEQQTLGPREAVDMPVFFYLDPEFALDPAMDRVSEVILSYTFFESTPQP